MHEGDLRLGMDYAFTRRDEVRQGATTLPNGLNQSTNTHIITGNIRAAITQRLSLQAGLPVIHLISEDQGRRESSTEFGDLSVSVEWYHTPRVLGRPTNLFYGAGMTVPVGDGVTNPITGEQNFASGTFDPFVSMLGVIALTPGWSLSGTFYTRQIFGDNSDGSQSGDYYQGSVGINFLGLSSGTIINARMRAILRGQDRYRGDTFPNSGGDWLYLDWGLTQDVVGAGEHALQLWTLLEWPVYQYVNGTQLTEQWSLRIGATLGFSLFGSHGATEGIDLSG